MGLERTGCNCGRISTFWRRLRLWPQADMGRLLVPYSLRPRMPIRIPATSQETTCRWPQTSQTLQQAGQIWIKKRKNHQSGVYTPKESREHLEYRTGDGIQPSPRRQYRNQKRRRKQTSKTQDGRSRMVPSSSKIQRPNLTLENVEKETSRKTN